ncbi:MAG: DUF2332 domain-containing protein [Anaerolineales bacterium]|nr:DUF2332 domain-containing protein [Anaerolineales bacterium]
MTDDYQGRLLHRFQQQREFAAGYSPLYASLFGTVADWLAVRPPTPLVAWLLETCAARQPFDVTLLLAAGLHRDILLGVAEVSELAAYYPSVGGTAVSPPLSPAFATALHDAIWARREPLAQFIQTATVQTNETGRGLVWLLPLHYLGWGEVQLLDLGASAGLNLLAEQRAYRFVDAQEQPVADFGAGEPVQFTTRLRQDADWLHHRLPLPRIVGRLGGDIAPFGLETAVAEQTLAAYVWGDQTHRLQRLREAIAAYHATAQTAAPIQLYPLDLPDGLPRFLLTHLPPSTTPLVIYNTYITMYLAERGAAMRDAIAAWASQQPRPVLWLQWEPPHGDPTAAPQFGWCEWTADFFHNGRQQQWRLGWVQPHGTDVVWEIDMAEWGRVLPDP